MKTEQSQVLVVDDNEANRDVLSRRLQRQNIVVTTAENGRQALELVRQQPFDLILLDIMMPEMNGYQVLQHLKADPTLKHIPVVMISAVDDVDSVVRCVELGAEDYLFKPFNPVLLRARIGASLEKKRLRDKERAYLQAVKQELELGRRTQADFFPAQVPQPPGWQIAGLFYPAREVAGDFYDTFALPGNRLGLVIADVCDKGVGAALFMVLVRSLIRAFAEQVSSATTGSDALALDAVPLVNNYITIHHQREQSRIHMFATLFFGVLDPSTGTLTYVNAGHTPPAIVGAAGIRMLLEPTGPAVGIMRDSMFRREQLYLEPGDILLAYTDGITEARSATNEMFGEERLFELLNQPVDTVDSLFAALEQRVRSYIGDMSPEDDITMLAAQRLPNTAE
jgi:serine phosphatase RsbU (regulator of sigma subunit)